MCEEIEERTLKEARYIAETGATVRATAEKFSSSKSTVHKDVTERLFMIDGALFAEVKKALKINLAERHIRGGEATKRKYEKLKSR